MLLNSIIAKLSTCVKKIPIGLHQLYGQRLIVAPIPEIGVFLHNGNWFWAAKNPAGFLLGSVAPSTGDGALLVCYIIRLSNFAVTSDSEVLRRTHFIPLRLKEYLVFSSLKEGWYFSFQTRSRSSEARTSVTTKSQLSKFSRYCI